MLNYYFIKIMKFNNNIRFNSINLLCILSFFTLILSSHTAYSNNFRNNGFADIVEPLLPAVVNIRATSIVEGSRSPLENFNFPPGSPFEDFFERFQRDDNGQGQKRKLPALGSGFIISDDGYIVTNNHVISNAEEIVVFLNDDDSTELKAEIIGTDERTDLALLKVDTDEKLPFVAFGDSSKLRVGDWVIAIGNPHGLGGTVTTGIVSARNRDIRSGPYDDFIQTDAPINKGNSGGPLFNIDGQVIGVNTAIISQTGGSIGLGFSIPSLQVKRVIEQLREFGTTKRGWLGVVIQHVSKEIAESMNLETTYGALVSNVYEDSPADKAGVKVGDIILKVNNIDIKNSRQLTRVIANQKVNSTAKIEVWRRGKIVSLNVTLGELEKINLAELNQEASPKKQKQRTTEIKEFGIKVIALNPNTRKQYNIPSQIENGLIVTDVDRDSEAAERGLKPFSVILEANQENLSNVDDLRNIIDNVINGNRDRILLLINYDGNTQFIPIKIREESDDDSEN